MKRLGRFVIYIQSLKDRTISAYFSKYSRKVKKFQSGCSTINCEKLPPQKCQLRRPQERTNSEVQKSPRASSLLQNSGQKPIYNLQPVTDPIDDDLSRWLLICCTSNLTHYQQTQKAAYTKKKAFEGLRPKCAEDEPSYKIDVV